MQHDYAKTLIRLVRDTADQLSGLDPTTLDVRVTAGSWSKKEILGHLIDSATNNQQRIVRAAAPDHTGELVTPGYDQRHWVHLQAWHDGDWNQLLVHWLAANFQIAQTVARISDASLLVPVRIGDHPPVSLKFMLEDYVEHLNHHIAQLQG